MHLRVQPMPDDKNTGRGKKYPMSAFVEAIQAEGGIAGTSDVADRVGCSYELAYKRLHELAEQDEIEQRRVANAHVWSTEDS